MVKSRVKIKKPKVKTKNISEKNVVGLAFLDSHSIQVHRDLIDRDYFLTLVHELVHVLLPDLSEKQVIQIEENYGSILWKAVLYLRRREANVKIHK